MKNMERLFNRIIAMLVLMSITATSFRISTVGTRRADLHPSFINSHLYNRCNSRKGYYPSLASTSNEDLMGDEEDRRAGLAVLLTVPVAWGTFEPAVRFVYDTQPDIPPFVFQLVYYAIATTSLALIAQASRPSTENVTTVEYGSSFDKTTKEKAQSSNSLLSIQGGLELGTYLFLGNGMQVVGLKTIASDRAAFLLQLTTIFVPLLQSFLSRNFSVLPVRTWLACFMALAGVALIGLDSNGSSANDVLGLSFSQGDLYIVLAALFYTFHCLRLETYAKKTTAISLAVAKASTETVWCAIVIIVTVAISLFTDENGTSSALNVVSASGNDILQYKDALIESFQDQSISYQDWLKLCAATTWIGLVTVGYTISAQSYGQARVPPSTANLIYTIQPIFTALVAFLVLGETLGISGYAGGFLIGSAVLVVISSEDTS